MAPTPSASAAASPTAMQAVRVWDLPTRLFHWLLAAAVLAAVGTAWVGGNAMVWHMRLGLLVLALLVFRLLWGVVGGHWSRFASFTYGPGTLLRYLRGQSREDEHHEVGHSPMGSLSVFALLGVLAVQVGTGLVSDDEIATTGPLNAAVSKNVGLQATSWHHGPGQWLILALVGVHVAAIAYYRWARNKDLVSPMVLGDKTLPVGTPASRDTAVTRALALGLAGACAVLAVWLNRQGG